MQRSPAPSNFAAAPAVNFAISASRSNLADLIRRLSATKAAAEAACTAQSRAEEKHRGSDGKLQQPASPKVCGGMTEPMVIEVGGRRSEQPAREWFYSTREEIEKSGTAEQMADWDRQERANGRAYPKALRAAERASAKALDTWTAAEIALTRYRPASVSEAIELLQLAGATPKKVGTYLDVDDDGLRAIIRNCTTALQVAYQQ